jgi:hypothetical protein
MFILMGRTARARCYMLLSCAYDCKPTDIVSLFRHFIVNSHVCKGVWQHEEGVGRMTTSICFWYGMIVSFSAWL